MKLQAEDCSGKDEGKIGLLKKSMYGPRDAASIWERDRQGHPENWGHELERSSNNKKRETSELTHGDDFVVTGTKEECLGAQEAAGERVSNQSEDHRGRFDKEHQSAASETMLERDRDIVSTRSSTR